MAFLKQTALSNIKQPAALIIGAGPAGLTAALELLRKTDILPIVIEAENQPGGISKTLYYKGYRMDIGGHRFFSKSDKIMSWWTDILPLASCPARDDKRFGRKLPLSPNGPDPEYDDKVMLIRKRLSRILHNRTFFPYPLQPRFEIIRNLGYAKTAKIGLDYLRAAIFPIRPEKTLEDFLINRFGKELFVKFFKDYTEKVWGRTCAEIDASWGIQRIKGLSIASAVRHVFKEKEKDICQKDIETSLINFFLYPKYGPGQLWEEVTEKVEELGGVVIYGHRVEKLFSSNGGRRIKAGLIRDPRSGDAVLVKADYFLSSMPVKDLSSALEAGIISDKVARIAFNLPYRDFITVGVALSDSSFSFLRDNWIYIQEPDVRLGRIQLFHNWSPYLVPEDNRCMWLGCEYFATEGDQLWTTSNFGIFSFAVRELVKLGIIKSEKYAVDGMVARIRKAYPAYWGSYDHFEILRDEFDQIENLFLIGRNGMHRYNNQDHSMLAAMEAVKNITDGVSEKGNIWNVNSEESYHEHRRPKS